MAAEQVGRWTGREVMGMGGLRQWEAQQEERTGQPGGSRVKMWRSQ